MYVYTDDNILRRMDKRKNKAGFLSERLSPSMCKFALQKLPRKQSNLALQKHTSSSRKRNHYIFHEKDSLTPPVRTKRHPD